MGPILSGDQKNSESVVMLNEFPYNGALFGLVSCFMTPVQLGGSKIWPTIWDM